MMNQGRGPAMNSLWKDFWEARWEEVLHVCNVVFLVGLLIVAVLAWIVLVLYGAKRRHAGRRFWALAENDDEAHMIVIHIVAVSILLLVMLALGWIPLFTPADTPLSQLPVHYGARHPKRRLHRHLRRQPVPAAT